MGQSRLGKYYGQWIMEACVFTYDFDRFAASKILSLIGKYKITTLCCPPTMYRMIMLEDVDSYDLPHLCIPPRRARRSIPTCSIFWKEHTGLTIYRGIS